MQQRVMVNEQFWQSLRNKEIILANKFRIKLIVEGNLNIRFFHNCLKTNWRKNNIMALSVCDSSVEGVQNVKQKVYLTLRTSSRKKLLTDQYWMA